jgi:hypothetical protein
MQGILAGEQPFQSAVQQAQPPLRPLSVGRAGYYILESTAYVHDAPDLDEEAILDKEEGRGCAIGYQVINRVSRRLRRRGGHGERDDLRQ